MCYTHNTYKWDEPFPYQRFSWQRRVCHLAWRFGKNINTPSPFPSTDIHIERVRYWRHFRWVKRSDPIGLPEIQSCDNYQSLVYIELTIWIAAIEMRRILEPRYSENQDSFDFNFNLFLLFILRKFNEFRKTSCACWTLQKCITIEDSDGP
jgi:hypothetical protein